MTAKRIGEMCELRVAGMTYQEIGEKFEISRQRVHQLLDRYKGIKQYSKYWQIATQRRLFAMKIQALTHYGNGKLACVRCGYSDVRALTIDHINGRKAVGHPRNWGGSALYRWLIKHDFPKGYQTLCMNCQWIKRFTEDRQSKVGRPHKHQGKKFSNG